VGGPLPVSVVYGEATPLSALTPPLSWWIHCPAPPPHCPHSVLPPQYNESLPCPSTCGLGPKDLLQLKQSFFLISSRLVSSSSFSLPFHSLWNGFMSRSFYGTNGLGKGLVFGIESAKSRARRMASYKV
jgi:hypothetical protein